MFKTQCGQTYHVHTVHSRPLFHPNHNNMQHDDQEDEDQHFQDNFDNENVAAMDNGTHPVEQRKDHPHLTGMCTIYFVGNV